MHTKNEIYPTCFSSAGRTSSSQQVFLVSQIKIRQCECDIEFTFLDRMRFGVTLSVSIFCRGGRCNEGRIDYSALFEYEVMLTYQKTCAIMMTTSTKGAN